MSGGSYGAITYTSSSTAAANVNSTTGVITPVAAGTTTITATQAAVAGVNAQATQTYTLTVNALPDGAVVSGGLTWTRNNSTAPVRRNWNDANSTCNNLIVGGADNWRLPTQAELLYIAGTGALRDAGWTLSGTWSSDVGVTGVSHVVVGLSNGFNVWLADSTDAYVSCVH